MKVYWAIQGAINAISREHTVYRDAFLHVQKEVITPKRGMKMGRPRSRYYIDGDPREFRTEDDMVAALEKENLQSISKE